jgi:hypothetical protein
MKHYDFLEAWQDLVGVFGVDIAPPVAPAGDTRAMFVRLPSRTGWTWKRLKPKPKKTELKVWVTLNDETGTDVGLSKE